MEFILSGDLFDAEHALRIGLVNGVLAPQELLGHCLAYAEKLAERAPIPQQLAKEVVHRIHGMSLDEALRLESDSFRDLGDTDDLAEGTNAFAEKRPAQFKGR
jgi:enoyl-CoA hydratase/carnithine racemase